MSEINPIKSNVYLIKQVSTAPGIKNKFSNSIFKEAYSLTLKNYMGPQPEHFPQVSVKLVYDIDSIYVQFLLVDRYVISTVNDYQGPVFHDSCVEFFFAPGINCGPSYFNIEMNCGGTMLFHWHPDREEIVKIPFEDAKKIKIVGSMPKIVYPEITDSITWTITYRLPFDIIRKYCHKMAQPSKNTIWKANFYKCADKSSKPHWLTWTKVNHHEPQFHLPEYFGKLIFE